MASTQDLQTLLRFLSQDAKVPLAEALGKVKDLQAAKLVTASDIAKADFESIKSIFADEKVARQVLNAAKRVSKKRASGDAPEPAPKKTKQTYGQPLSPAELEESLALPKAERDEEKLASAVVHTNRAPLVLAFACVLLKYTMPEQPISSRLSMAQAVTSMNSRSKAIYLGIEGGKAADEEGWGEGQPLVNIMSRDIRVMKRWGYEWEEDASQSTLRSSQDTLVEEPGPREPALWGVDLEALKKGNQSGAVASKVATSNLPIYSAQAARAYLLKSFESPKTGDAPKAKRTNAAIVAEKERNLGLLLGALELLYESWCNVLSKDDLNKRAWGWYVRVRPEVAQGTAGWGGKGEVKLADVLELRRPSGQ